MENMQEFSCEAFGTIRTTMIDNAPWFVAADVCNALEISNARDAVTRLDEDEKGVVSTDTLGGNQQVNIISESGLYSLVLGSRKPEAKQFKRWITHEVLPTIRRTGQYNIISADSYNRPANTDDYMSAARTLANCRQDRIGMVLLMFERAGLNTEGLGRYMPCNQIKISAHKEIKPIPAGKKPPEDVHGLMRFAMDHWGMSTRQLAEIVGLNPGTIRAYASGGKKIPQSREPILREAIERWGRDFEYECGAN